MKEPLCQKRGSKDKVEEYEEKISKAWRLVRKYKEETKIPPPGRVPRIRPKAQYETNPSQPMPIKHKDPTPKAPKVKASTNRASSKRKGGNNSLFEVLQFVHN